MQAEPSCQLLFLVNSLILAFYLLLCLLLSALHFVLLPECRVYFLLPDTEITRQKAAGLLIGRPRKPA